MYTIKNLTPHTINVYGENDTIVASYESLGIARAESREKLVGSINGIPLVEMEYGEPTDLPEPEEGTKLVVSMLTATAAQRSGRTTDDLLIVADLVRDDQGRVIGCRKFSRLY